ncbi:hypothetical protein SAMN04488550_4156 [Gordonia malaquae]|uniref:Uncharacterized protein n=1 Tax=Gordonia malaquae NBRC 108250 TaxID=1223542 RepID=M3VH64_GORML|nr:hypothetical protein [Gordonia malaquae]GAC81684.1 hypothetical protein GM1_041_00550 [Gordonia malaquae NBRC 108250]SEE25612.1 hypothetical protein SAMN04488550_4156 [Gordonia malaquae]
MSTNLHTVTIHGDTVNEDDWTSYENVRIEFACSGDETSECHQYPDCGCADWDDHHEANLGPEHAAVPHKQCWMQDWFDNDCIVPMTEDVVFPLIRDDGRWKPGMSGPIRTTFELDYIAWQFEDGAR